MNRETPLRSAIIVMGAAKDDGRELRDLAVATVVGPGGSLGVDGRKGRRRQSWSEERVQEQEWKTIRPHAYVESNHND